MQSIGDETMWLSQLVLRGVNWLVLISLELLVSSDHFCTMLCMVATDRSEALRTYGDRRRQLVVSSPTEI